MDIPISSPYDYLSKWLQVIDKSHVCKIYSDGDSASPSVRGNQVCHLAQV